MQRRRLAIPTECVSRPRGAALARIGAAAGALVLSLAAPAAGAEREEIADEDFTVAVDPRLVPLVEPFEDEGELRELGVFVDPHGNRSEFVVGELVVSGGDAEEIEALAGRLRGRIVTVGDARRLAPAPAITLVRFTPRRVAPDEVALLIRAIERDAHGPHTVSSDAALGTIAAWARESGQGLALGLNFAAYGDTVRMRTTQESPGAPNAFAYPTHCNAVPSVTCIHDYGVGEAWNMLARANRLGTRTAIAVIDAGYGVHADRPQGPGGVFVPPAVANTIPCTGGPCPWHGTNVRDAAMAVFDNGFGAAGSAGQVGAPIELVRNSLLTDTAVRIADARNLGARIVNMSFSGETPKAFASSALWINAHTSAARNAGVLLFASAGNNGLNVDRLTCVGSKCWESVFTWPCEATGVTCVGGIAAGSTARAPGSNFGGPNVSWETVDIFAPFTVRVPLDPGDPGFANAANGSKNVNGTSIASPFAAGVAALVWAASPGLSANAVEATLITTGTGTPRRLDAESAVRSALVNEPPDIRITGPPASVSWPRGYLPVSANATDLEDGTPTVLWFVNGVLQPQAGTSVVLALHHLPFGQHTITARATDTFGWNVPDAAGGVLVTLTNTAPTVSIASPSEGDTFYLYPVISYPYGAGDEIQLQASSSDSNNDPPELPDASVAWYVNGAQVATGHSASINAMSLGAGTHTVRFEASDGELVGWEERTIVVEYWAPTALCPPGGLCSAP